MVAGCFRELPVGFQRRYDVVNGLDGGNRFAARFDQRAHVDRDRRPLTPFACALQVANRVVDIDDLLVPVAARRPQSRAARADLEGEKPEGGGRAALRRGWRLPSSASALLLLRETNSRGQTERQRGNRNSLDRDHARQSRTRYHAVHDVPP
jgi:hypothetical protein